MHTITLKTDDNFFEMLNEMVKSLGTTKSELIRNAVLNYKESLEHQALKTQLKKASQRVRESSLASAKERDETLCDQIRTIDNQRIMQNKIATLTPEEMRMLDKQIKIVLGL